jgi:hypothetical protein
MAFPVHRNSEIVSFILSTANLALSLPTTAAASLASVRLTTSPPLREYGILDVSDPYGPPQPATWLALFAIPARRKWLVAA